MTIVELDNDADMIEILSKQDKQEEQDNTSQNKQANQYQANQNQANQEQANQEQVTPNQAKAYIKGANPYMPLWEHVPDGEPRVFCHNGEMRVYVYGSHDIERTMYCGRNYVVWSAPVTDLTDWTYHGVAYETHYDSVLYAPDVVKKGDNYYLYAAEQAGSKIVVATSKTPYGPFENPVETKLGFDPGILVDDDGRTYAYWGGCACPCYIAELENDMATIKEETIVSNPLGHSSCPWNPVDDGHISLIDGFFEASSPRKVMGKYVYIYSKRYEKPVPELGVYEPNNGFLSYRFADSPFGPFHDGGDISFNGGEILHDADGAGTMTYQWGNNHGSIMEINGKWYVFYHRQIGVNEYSRQAMLEPIDVAMGADGNLYIGDIKFIKGEPVSSKPVEMTSQGPHINGLDAYKWISAGYACHIFGSKLRTYIEPAYEQRDDLSTPIVNITSGTTVGFRYLQFGANSPKSVTIMLGRDGDREAGLDGAAEPGCPGTYLFEEGCEKSAGISDGIAAGISDGIADGIVNGLTGKINVRIDSYNGRIISTVELNDGSSEGILKGGLDAGSTEKILRAELSAGVVGKHAVYFEFILGDGEAAVFNRFTFD